MPGRSPHPRRDPAGHSYGLPEPRPPAFIPERWRESEAYRYGIDLHNHGYWWECHEVFEALWYAVGPKTDQGRFFQALIQLAAGNLKHATGNQSAAQRLWQRALTKLEDSPLNYMGLDVRALMKSVREGEPSASNFPLLILSI